MLDITLNNEQCKVLQTTLPILKEALADRLAAPELTPRLEENLTRTFPVLEQIASKTRAHLAAIGEGISPQD